MYTPEQKEFLRNHFTADDFRKHVGGSQRITVLFNGGISNEPFFLSGVVQSVDEKVVIFSEGTLIPPDSSLGAKDIPVKNLPVPIKQIRRKFDTKESMFAFLLEITLLKPRK